LTPSQGHDQVGLGQLRGLDLALELDAHAEAGRPLDQDVQQAPATDPVAMPTHVDRLFPLNSQ
jgi:hypothetical protein